MEVNGIVMKEGKDVFITVSPEEANKLKVGNCKIIQ